MIYAKNLVNSWGVLIIVEASNYFGFPTSARNAILSIFMGIMQSSFDNIATIAFLPIVYVFQQLSTADISIPSWISDGVDFVVNTVRPNFDWLVDGINNFWAFWDNRTYYIKKSVIAAYGNLQTFIDRVNYLWDNASDAVTDISENVQQWVIDALPEGITNAVTWLNNNKAAIANFINRGMAFALQIAADPATVIYNFLPKWFRDAVTVINSDLGYFAWLANEGKRLIVSFFANPQEFIKNIVIDNLLDWLLDKINEAW